MEIVLHDNRQTRLELLPLTYTRPVADIIIGLYSMAERWANYLPGDYSYDTIDYLSELYKRPAGTGDELLHIASEVIATAEAAEAAAALEPGQRLVDAAGHVVAWRGEVEKCADVEFAGEVIALKHVYDIFCLNDKVLRDDFRFATKGAVSAGVDSTNIVCGDSSQLFVDESAKVTCATLNTTTGPIYIGPGVTVMEGCHLRGPLALLDGSQTNMGTLIYGATTLGPHCKVGGELNNVVMQACSNKAHAGFLGNAVIGSWCNIGGGTTASNLKNDYSEIKLWNYPAGRFLRTGLQFCGLIMGDHSKCAINTSFNTATTVGVGCNIVSEGMPRVFIPSFTKGGTAGFDNVNMSEFLTIARRVMARRGCELTGAHERMFRAIAEYSDSFK